MKHFSKQLFVIPVLVIASLSLFATPTSLEDQSASNSVSEDANAQVKEDTILKGAHIINLSSVDSRKISDKFIIYNDTDKDILVNVYYKHFISPTKSEWKFAGGKKIEANDDEDFEMLEGHIANYIIYAIRIKDDTGNDYQLNWVAEHHDMKIHIGVSF